MTQTTMTKKIGKLAITILLSPIIIIAYGCFIGGMISEIVKYNALSKT